MRENKGLLDATRKLTLRIPDSLLEKMKEHALRAFPEECCGFLIGNAAQSKEVSNVVASQNRAPDMRTQRYTVDPLDHVRLDVELESSGKKILGFYHSHPNTSAKPSLHDVENAWPWYSYLIVAVSRDSVLDTASWVLGSTGKCLEPEGLKVLA